MRLPVSLVLWLCLSALAAAQVIMPEYGQADIEDFLDQPLVTEPRLSPNGRHVAYMVRSRNAREGDVLVIDDLDDPDDRNIQRASFGEYPILNLAWASDDRLLVTISLSSVVSIGGFSFQAPVVRTLSYDRRDLSTPVIMFESEGRQVFSNIYNAFVNIIVHTLPHDPEHVLMAAYRGDALHLWRVNVFTGEADVEERGNFRTMFWHANTVGEAVMRVDSVSDGRQLRVFTRDPSERRWRRTRTYRVNELVEHDAEFDWAGVSDQPGQIYVFSRLESADLRGLYLYDLATETYVEVIAEHPRVDISHAIVDTQNGAFVGYGFQDERLEVEIIDPDLRRHYRAIVSFFGDEVSVLPMSFAGNRIILFVSGPREAGVYYVYDKNTHSIDPLMALRPRLPADVLHDVEIIRYEASDGLDLTAYLTVPRRGMGPNTPLILMPHGGPEMRDRYDFDLFAQYFASEGYAVIQPNFRGSSGYGRAFAEAGYRRWGERMQQDLDDVVEHLIAQGRVAPDRICIAGFSYGGYAALMGGATRPDLYQCVFAGAAVTDLIDFVDHWEDINELAHDYWTTAIGDTRSDRDRLYWVSPVNLADRMTMPVLLVHARDDDIVPYEHSDIMAEALAAAGAEFFFQSYGTGGHSFSRTGILRSIMQQSVQLFDRTIGPERSQFENVFSDEPLPSSSAAK